MTLHALHAPLTRRVRDVWTLPPYTLTRLYTGYVVPVYGWSGWWSPEPHEGELKWIM